MLAMNGVGALKGGHYRALDNVRYRDEFDFRAL
jgi:hypothetical protein